MQQYYYRKGKVAWKAVGYTLLSAFLVLLGVFMVTKWDMSFMFSNWKGYVMMIVYFLMTLGSILSAIESFGKWSKSRGGVPAFVLGDDRFLLYDKRGMQHTVSFADCTSVNVKHKNYSRHTHTYDYELVIVYSNRATQGKSTRTVILLNELDRPKSEIESMVLRTYNNFRNQNNNGYNA